MKNLKTLIFLFLSLLLFAALPSAAQKTAKPKGKTADQKHNTAKEKVDPSATLNAEKNFLSTFETAVIDEINEARQNPQKFIGYLEEYKKAMKGNILYLPNRNGIIMNEGAAVIDDAISDLKKLSKTDALAVSKGIFKAANLQLTDLKENSALSHRGKDGSDVEIRLLKFGMPGSNYAENICYLAKTARDVVMTMILDDGVKNRPHRKNVFSPKFKRIGVACGDSSKKETICVAVFADTFAEKK